jgi:NADH-quinone oxidoreductase subunit E
MGPGLGRGKFGLTRPVNGARQIKGGKMKTDVIKNILKRHENSQSNLIAILRDVQEEFSYLPEDVMTFIAKSLGITPAAVFGAATFYSHFTLEPKGKHVIRVCDGTACHVKKSEDIIKAIEKELGLTATKRTSADGLFTLEIVACLGACGLAPVVVINEAVHGSMTVAKTKELLAEFRKGGEANAK